VTRSTSSLLMLRMLEGIYDEDHLTRMCSMTLGRIEVV